MHGERNITRSCKIGNNFCRFPVQTAELVADAELATAEPHLNYPAHTSPTTSSPALSQSPIPTMTTLEDLPNELFCKIFSCLGCIDLSAICLVSHRMNNIAEPLLYTAATLDGRNLNGAGITVFLRTVLSHPSRGRCVQHLNVLWFTAVKYILDPTLDQQAASDHRLFDAEAQRVGMSGIIWSQDRQLILLLHVLPNLRELDLHPLALNYSVLNQFLEDTVSTPSERLPASLRSLARFGGAGIGAPVTSPTLLVALLRLPSLRNIDVFMETAEDDTETDAELTALLKSATFRGKSPVTKLGIEYSNLSISHLNWILQVPTALTHFSYADDDLRRTRDDPETTSLGTALRHLRPTLQFLHLGYIRVPEPGEGDTELYNLGSFRDWPVLRTVKCGLEVLLGRPVQATARLVDLVPAVIQDLEITWETAKLVVSEWKARCMLGQAVQLLQEKEAYGLHGLTRLTVHTPVTMIRGGKWVKGHVRVVDAALREVNAAGVEIRVD